MLKEADGYIADGVHPRLINDGFRLASQEAKKALDELCVKKEINRELLLQVARTSLKTKLDQELAEKLTEAIVDAILAIKQDGEEINLHMVEIMEMQHKSVRYFLGSGTHLVNLLTSHQKRVGSMRAGVQGPPITLYLTLTLDL